jgi:acetate kinase
VNAQRELHVPALNRGTSSLKLGLYRVRSLHTQRLVSREAESIGKGAAVYPRGRPPRYPAKKKKLDATQLKELVDRRSGLLGVSGVSADLRDLHKVAHSNPDARLAIDMFCYSAAKHRRP